MKYAIWVGDGHSEFLTLSEVVDTFFEVRRAIRRSYPFTYTYLQYNPVDGTPKERITEEDIDRYNNGEGFAFLS